MSGVVYDSVFYGNNGVSEALIANKTTLRGCIITNNVTAASSSNYSVCLTSSCRLYDCLVKDNVTRYSGVSGGFAENCRFINNSTASANWSNPGGGAARNAALTNCYFFGNSTHRLGGAIRGGIVVNCVVVSNTVTRLAIDNDCYGGGIYEAELVENCTVLSNFCGKGGGVADCAFVTNSYIAYNVARDYGGGASASALSGCTVEHNVAIGYDNSNYGGAGGGLMGGSATNCVFRDNSCSATCKSSIVYDCDIFDTSMHAKEFNSCRIANVSNAPLARAIGAVGYPNGFVTSNIYMIGCSVMRNCQITNCNWRSLPGVFVNSAMFHPGYGGTNRIENCTIAGNYFYILTRGFDHALNAGVFVNCAILGNSAADIRMLDDGAVVLSNCVYMTKSWSRVFKDGFADGENWQLSSIAEARFSSEGDAPYCPKPLSPLRGKGLILDWMSDGTDIAGNPRLRDGVVDVGCYQCWLNQPGLHVLFK